MARAKEQEIIESIREDSEYNAYDKDIAVVNIFFGKPTTIGRGFLSYLFSIFPETHAPGLIWQYMLLNEDWEIPEPALFWQQMVLNEDYKRKQQRIVYITTTSCELFQMF